MRLQVIAKGFQTYGEDLDIDKAELSVDVRLKRPGEQYSIYKNHGQNADAGKDKAAPSGKDSESGDSAKDKRADSANLPLSRTHRNRSRNKAGANSAQF